MLVREPARVALVARTNCSFPSVAQAHELSVRVCVCVRACVCACVLCARGLSANCGHGIWLRADAAEHQSGREWR